MVEWGEGIAEGLSDDWLEVRLDRSSHEERRVVTLHGHGRRWADEPLASLLRG